MEYGASYMGPKVVLEDNVHDLIVKISLGGVGRQHLWQKSLEIFRQRRIYNKRWRERSDLNSKLPMNLEF